MSCEVANASPFGADSLLNVDWQKSPGDQNGGDLQAIADFNVEFDANNGSDTINPQIAFGNNSSQQQNNNQYNGSFEGLDQTLSPEPSSYGAYPGDLNGQPNSSPYFSSVESTSIPTFHQPPHMRNQQFQHRRSVSEPPTGPNVPPQQVQQQHQHQQPGPAVMFHRDNHFLGKPIGQKPVPLKSQYKNRPQRQYPQARKQRNMVEPYPRPEMRRAQTQPMRHMPPTSVPVQHMPTQYYQQHQHHPSHPQQHQHVQMMMQEPQYVSSRVCTPTPDAGMVSTPHQNIDPTLTAAPTPAVIPETPMTQQTSPKRKTVSIPLTVEELRSMIFEAVQKAVRGEEGRTPAVVQETSPVHEESCQAAEENNVVEQDQMDQMDQMATASPPDFETTI